MALTTIDSMGGSAARSITDTLTKRGRDTRSRMVEALTVVALGLSFAVLVVFIVDVDGAAGPLLVTAIGVAVLCVAQLTVGSSTQVVKGLLAAALVLDLTTLGIVVADVGGAAELIAAALLAVAVLSLTVVLVDTNKFVEWTLVGALAAALLILAVLLANLIDQSWPVWSRRGADFVQGELNASPSFVRDRADGTSFADVGIASAIRGTLTLAAIVAVVAFPLGVACAVFLEEYAGRSAFARWTRVNVRNLAGVPSIVYGLLGLAVFVRVLNGLGGEPAEWFQDQGFFVLRWIGNVFDWLGGNEGRSVLAGGLALSALVLPVVVITTSEALRAVPRSIREGAYGVGATKWETVRHHVLPAAAPGILTGTVLSLARAAGEAAPILIVGAQTGLLRTGNKGFIEQLSGPFTALPAAIFSFARQPGAPFREVTAAASLALLVLVLIMNGFAIWLRNRYERKW